MKNYKKQTAINQEEIRLANSYKTVWEISVYQDNGIKKLEEEKEELRYALKESRRRVMDVEKLMDEKIMDLVLQNRVSTESISLLQLFRTDLRQGYDSSWTALLNTPNRVNVLYLTCRDGESTSGLTKKIENRKMSNGQ